MYNKPKVIELDNLAEGIFTACGGVITEEESANAPKCDSEYIKGNFVSPDHSQWAAGEQRGYKKQFGCLGCPAFTQAGGECGLKTHYIASGEAESYKADDGNRMPSWERKGYGPDDPVTDWNM
ncbi:MAG: hypothetical protein K6F00_02025 [Lachnospiraceae bacterium]|nr:hypothetical protein [Lachnospiraceae bacterium]